MSSTNNMSRRVRNSFLKKNKTRKTSRRLYKNVHSDDDSSLFYQKQLERVSIIKTEDGSHFINLNASNLGATLKHDCEFHPQSLVLFDELPEYINHCQAPASNSIWKQTTQTWDGNSEENYIFVKNTAVLSTNERLWNQINLNDCIKLGIVGSQNIKGLNSIGNKFKVNELNHRGIVQAYDYALNFAAESIARKTRCKQLTCFESNIFTSTDYNKICDFMNLTTKYGASKEYYEQINKIESSQTLNVQSSIMGPGYLMNLTIAPMNLSTIHILRQGRRMVFALDPLTNKEKKQLIAELGHSDECPQSALSQMNIFPEISLMNSFAKKHNKRIYCGIQHPGSMAIIQSNCVYWAIPLNGNEIWMESILWGPMDSRTLNAGLAMFKSQAQYFFSFPEEDTNTKKNKKKNTKRNTNKNKNTQCQYVCENQDWEGDMISQEIIANDLYEKFEGRITKWISNAKKEESKKTKREKKELNQTMLKLTQSHPFNKVFLYVYICMCIVMET